MRAAAAPVDLSGASEAVPFNEFAAEVATGVCLLRAVHHELARHEPEREHHYSAIDPEGLARCLGIRP
jgi:hypothetical protein